MILHVSIIWAGTAKSSQTLAPIVGLADDWISLGSSFYVLVTSESIAIWQGRLMAVISTEDSVIITEMANIYEAGGWMPQTFWEWLRKDRSKTLKTLAGYPTLLKPPPNPFQT